MNTHKVANFIPMIVSCLCLYKRKCVYIELLNDKIKLLEGKPVSNYVSLYGSYSKDDIVYYIGNISGGQVKYCSVEITIPSDKLFGKYIFSQSDVIPICAHIMREFSAAAHIINDIKQQSEANAAKGCFIVYRYGQNVLPNSIVTASAGKVTITIEIQLPLNTSAIQGKWDNMTEKEKIAALSGKKRGIISSRALKLLLIKNLPKLVEDFISKFDNNSFIYAINLYRNQ